MFVKNNSTEYLLLILLLIFCYFSCFLRLGSYPLLMWDESHYAMNAFELLKNHNFILITYDHSPDMENTKPPLMVWTIALFMKVFGYGELAIRLPSAIASMITA